MTLEQRLARANARASSWPSEPCRLTVLFGIWCTLRVGEILELRRRDIRIRRSRGADGVDIVTAVVNVERSAQHIEGEPVIDIGWRGARGAGDGEVWRMDFRCRGDSNRTQRA